MDRLAHLLREQDPAELRRHGLAVDAEGRLVSVHEVRARVGRQLPESSLSWQWPFRARARKRLQGLETPRRLARGTKIPIPAEPDAYEELEISSDS